MTKKTGKGQVQEYQGKPLSPALDYTFEYEVYDSVAEAKASENWPNDSDMLKFVNQRAERSAKASSYQAVIAPLKEAFENSAEFKRQQLIKAALAFGMSQEQAEAIADSKL